MEDLDYRYDRRTTRFVLVILGLLLIAGSLATMLIISFSSASDIDGSVLRLLAHLAWISLALLLGVLIFLAWTIMRFARHKLLGQKMPAATEHPDAWAEAGKRLKLDTAAPNAASGEWRDDSPGGEDD